MSSLIVLNEIPNMSSDTLRQLIALFRVMTLGNQLKEFSSKLVKKTGRRFKQDWELPLDSLAQRLNEEIASLDGLAHQELVGLLYDELTQRWSIGEIDQVAMEEKMIEAALEKRDNARASSSLQHKAECIANSVKADVKNEMSKYSTQEDEEKLADEIGNRFDSLSKREQQAIMDALKVDKRSSEAIRKAVLAGGIPVMINAGGFASYLAVTALIHTVGTTLGAVTVPFIVYTGAMSTLGFIAGPFGYLLMGLFGAYQYRKAKYKIAGAICRQLILQAQLCREERSFHDSREAIYGDWTDSDYNSFKETLNQEMTARAQWEEKATELEDELEAARKAGAGARTEYLHDKRAVQTKLKVALDNAQHEVDILSPWISRGMLYENEPIRKALDGAIRRGITVKILFGMSRVADPDYLTDSRENSGDKTSHYVAAMLAHYYREFPNFHIARGAEHGKYLLCDDTWYLRTSLNMLSNLGRTPFEDDGALAYDAEETRELREEYFQRVEGKNVDRVLLRVPRRRVQ